MTTYTPGEEGNANLKLTLKRSYLATGTGYNLRFSHSNGAISPNIVDPRFREPPRPPPTPRELPPQSGSGEIPLPPGLPFPRELLGWGGLPPPPPRSHFFQGPWGKLGEQGGGMTRRRLPRKRPRVAVLRPRGTLRLRRQSWQGSGAWHHQVLRSRYQVFTRIRRRPWKTRSRRRSWTGRRRPMRAGSS